MSNKILLLLRHAKSNRNIEVIDFERPLKKRGLRDAKTMGRWLSDQMLVPELILSSPAERAITTARKVCKAMNLETSLIKTDERIYNANPELLKQILQTCPETLHTLMLVGHNPAFEELLIDLADTPVEIPEDGKLLPTTALAELRFTGTWAKISSHCAQLTQITRVKNLADSSEPDIDTH